LLLSSIVLPRFHYSISGNVTNIKGDSLTVLVVQGVSIFDMRESYYEKHVAKIKAGRFSIYFTSRRPILYIRIKELDEEEPFYLLEKGCFVQIAIDGNKIISCSGKGSEAFQCQLALKSINSEFTGGCSVVNTDCLLRRRQFVNNIIIQRGDLIDRFKDKMSGLVYQIMKADNIGYMNYMEYDYLKLFERTRYIEQAAVVKKWVLDNYAANSTEIIPDSVRLYSIWFGAYQLLKETFYAGALESTMNIDYPHLSSIIKIICSDYSGNLRNSLLTLAFTNLKWYKYTSEELPIIFEKVIKITSGSYKSYLIQQRDAFCSGVKLFKFEFKDTTDKTIRLKDFAGKVVVLDFWFTGCEFCRDLNNNVKSVYVKLAKKSKDIAFVSVCLDKNAETWKRSIKSGLYTHDGYFDLYTNGLGFEHPFIEFYNFQGAPQLMVVSKDGRLVSIEHDWLYSDSSKVKFENLLTSQELED
jgi:thiol-disulfide isomerase/thioredoxin